MATSLTGLPPLETETSGFQANPKPWGTFLADDCSVNLYLPLALEFVPSRVSLEADGVVLFWAPCPGAAYQSPGSPGLNRGQPPSCRQDCQSIPSQKSAPSQAGLGTGSLMPGRTVLHVRPRTLLAAPDTDVMVSPTAQCKVQKNVALKFRGTYINTRVHTCKM